MHQHAKEPKKFYFCNGACKAGAIQPSELCPLDSPGCIAPGDRKKIHARKKFKSTVKEIKNSKI